MDVLGAIRDDVKLKSIPGNHSDNEVINVKRKRRGGGARDRFSV